MGHINTYSILLNKHLFSHLLSHEHIFTNNEIRVVVAACLEAPIRSVSVRQLSSLSNVTKGRLLWTARWWSVNLNKPWDGSSSADWWLSINEHQSKVQQKWISESSKTQSCREAPVRYRICHIFRGKPLSLSTLGKSCPLSKRLLFANKQQGWGLHKGNSWTWNAEYKTQHQPEKSSNPLSQAYMSHIFHVSKTQPK